MEDNHKGSIFSDFAVNLIMRDSWIDEVHMSASWLCSLFLSHLLSLGSSDRSHNAFRGNPILHSIDLRRILGIPSRKN